MSHEDNENGERSHDQQEIADKKNGVLRSDRGLQVWGDEVADTGAHGTGGQGTAERQARIAEGQRKQVEREKRRRDEND